MGSSPSPLLAPLVVALALSLALAGCGGGTTGAPLAATTATTPPPVAPTAGTTPAAPPATASRAAPAAAATPRASARRSAPARSTARPSPRPAVPAPTPVTRAVRPAPPKPRTMAVDELADLRLTQRASPAHYFQAGTVTGTYAGTMAAEARITSRGVLVSFTATLPGGTIVGHAVAVAVIDGSPTPGLRGTGEITGGTGRFAGIHGSGLRVTGRARPDGSWAHVHLVGTVSRGA